MNTVNTVNTVNQHIECGKEPYWDIDFQNLFDDSSYRKNNFNYFNTKEEAESMAAKLRAVLCGAAVIELPSQQDIDDVIYDAATSITCGGHDQVYAVDGQGKILGNTTYEEIVDSIRNIYDFVESKIMK